MISQLRTRNPHGDPEDTKDRYDKEGMPARTAQRVEEMARKVNELVEAFNRLENEIHQLKQ